MRKQARPDEPEVLRANSARWNQQWAELRQRNPSAQFSWYKLDSKDAREWVLPDLWSMTQGHCAFCDAFPLEDRTNEAVEHFKPKTDARFYLEAYTWTNLYYCCGFCQAQKNSQWNDDLLRPDAADYEFGTHFYYEFTTGEMKAVPGAEGSRARVTIEMYGLDEPPKRRMRQLELRKWQRSTDRNIDEFAYRDFVASGDGTGQVAA